ncbi:hypothetical protein Dcar01_00875 [Deinococcus carri]|uniref:DinB-like domain-containing protein n=1 Tax=Deinococcus carri TaxID=1211323 RepID=A0ABP9W474_9DEIO
MTQPSPQEQVAALRTAFPTSEVLAQRLEQELDAFEQTLRAALPHWDTRMPDRTWSPAQEAEHTILVNEGTGRIVRLLLSEKPLRPTPQEPGRTTEDGRRLAPAGLEPGPEQPLEALLARHAATRALLEQVRAEANPGRTFFHPFMGMLDAQDWLRMTTWHTGSHRRSLQRGLERLNAGEPAGA